MDSLENVIADAIAAYDAVNAKGERIGHSGSIGKLYGRAIKVGFVGDYGKWVQLVLLKRAERKRVTT